MRISLLLVVMVLCCFSCKEESQKSYDIKLVNKFNKTNEITARTIMDNKRIEVEVDSLGPQLQGLNFKNTIMAECTPLYIVFGSDAQAYNVFTIYSRGQTITLEPDANGYKSILEGDRNVNYVQTIFDSIYVHTKSNDNKAIHNMVLEIIKEVEYPCLINFKTLMVLQSDQRMNFSKEDSVEVIKFFTKQDTANNPLMRSLARNWLGQVPSNPNNTSQPNRPNAGSGKPFQLSRPQ